MVKICAFISDATLDSESNLLDGDATAHACSLGWVVTVLAADLSRVV